MKKFIIFILLITAASTTSALILTNGVYLGNSQPRPLEVISSTNNWGATNCGAQMSIALEETNNEVKTNEPVNLTICIANVSDSGITILDILGVRDFSFVITSPSNKNMSSISPSEIEYSSRKVLCSIPPNGRVHYSFDLRSVCNFNEIGTYKVIVKRKLANCELVSNQLFISVIPGVWKSKTTNAPNILF
jgi:hypothetical protein